MNRFIKSIIVSSALVILIGTSQVMAQNAGGGNNRRNRPTQAGGGGNNQGNRGNVDPAQRQQRMMERYQEVLEITNNDEWKAISPLVEKVVTARRETMRGNFGGGGRRDAAGGGGGGPASEQTGAMSELKKALDAKAGNSEIKVKIAAVATERQAKDSSLHEAQESLRKVLSVRQEGLAILNGLLPPAKS
jgi:hypothetical protein